MDLAAIAVAMQAQAMQSQMATAVLKQNLNSQAQVLQLLQPSADLFPQANLAPGVGGNVDVRA